MSQNNNKKYLIFGSPYSSQVTQVCSDALGNVYVAGEFSKSLLMGSYRFKETWGGFVAKIDSENKIVWMHRADIQVKGIETKGNQVVIMAQYSKDGLFCEEALINSSNSFNTMIAGFNTDSGELNWRFNLTSPSDVFSSDLYINNDGNIYFTGSYQGLLKVGDLQFQTEYSKNNYFGKANTKGEIQWVKQVSGGNDFVTGVSTSAITSNSNGKILLSGEITGTAYFGDFSISSRTIQFEYGGELSETEAYLASYNEQGECTSVGSIITEANIMDILCVGDILYVCGYFKGSLHQDYEPGISKFGNSIFLKSGIGKTGGLLETMFVAAFKNDSAIWAYAPSGINSSRFTSLAVDEKNNIFAGGIFYDQIDLPDGTQYLATKEEYSSNMLVLKFTPYGELIHSESAEVEETFKLQDICFGKEIIYAGFVNGKAVIQNMPIESRGKHHNGFIYRISSN